MGPQLVSPERLDRRSQRVRKQLIRHGQTLVAAPIEHEAAGVVHPSGELGRQPGLSDPGLARHQGDDPRTLSNRRPQAIQALQLTLAASERDGRGMRSA